MQDQPRSIAQKYAEFLWFTRISDALWERIEPLLPPGKPHPLGCHRPQVDNRSAMNAIFFVLGCPVTWNTLNATGPCSSSSAHRRFKEWVAAGVFEKMWKQGLFRNHLVVGKAWYRLTYG